MNSSGNSFKKGLAATAIGALAITGAPFLASSASAVPLSSAVTAPTDVELVNPVETTPTPISTKNDGQNATYRLEAVGGTGITSVKFTYTLGAGSPVPIATVSRNDNGGFSFEWDAAGVGGGTVVITAQGLDANGANVGTASTSGADIINNTIDTVNVNDGEATTVFQQPYGGANNKQLVPVQGTASVPSAPSLSWYDDDTDPATAGNQPGFSAPSASTNTSAAGATTGTFAGLLDITGYNYGSNDQLLVKADGATSDTESYQLVKQTITKVTATADSTTVQGNNPANVTITVTDQETPAKPIPGVQVYDSNGTFIGYTDVNGQIKNVAQPAGSAYYYANATSSTPYEPGLGDQKSDTITITNYAPTSTSLAATSRDGNTFDFDEFDYTGTPATSDIVLTVKDQNSQTVAAAGRTVNYYYMVTPFDTTIAPYRAPLANAAPMTAVTDANGKVAIDLPTPAASGTYELFASLAADNLGNDAIAYSKVLTFKAGQAQIAYDEANPESAPAGTSEVVSGKLALEDGTGLGARIVHLVLNTGGGNAYFTPQSSTGPQMPTVADYTTGADGSFTATVKDPSATPQPTETDTVTATTGNTVKNGDTDNPNATAAPQTVVFFNTAPPAGTTSVTITPDATTNVPGDVITGTVTLAPAAANVAITLTTDSGFFTDGSTVKGGKAPSHTSLGQTITVITNNAGVATFKLTEEKDAGFNDDGVDVATVTATAGTFSDSEDYKFTTDVTMDSNADDYLGDLQIVKSPASEQNNPTDPTPVNGQVAYDLVVLDTFGNPVGNVTVTTTTDRPQASVTGSSTSDYTSFGDIFLTDSRPETVTLTGTVTTQDGTYTNTSGGVTNTARTLTDSVTQRFYAPAFANSTFTLSHSPASPAVNSPVTETLTALDQEGNPIAGLAVSFVRTGPGNTDSNGDANTNTFTNANGEAYYTFVGTREGTATITAAVTGGQSGLSGSQTVTDSVTFTGSGGGGGTGPRVDVVAKLNAPNNGAADDRLRVSTKPIAANAVVRFYKRIGNTNQKVLLDVDRLGADGIAIYIAKDKNGRKFTRYFATVSRTPTTKEARTNSKQTR